MSTSALELNISAMLDDGTLASSASVALMIEQVEKAIVAAEKTAAEEQAKALDLTLSPDPNKARAARDEAVFQRDRLVAALPRLRELLANVYSLEEAAQWGAEYWRVKALVDAEAKKFAECRDLMTLLAERFASARAVDEQVHRVNASRPARVSGMHLDEVEVTARELQISTHAPSVIERTVLQTWEPGGRSLWPPARTIDPSVFAAPMHDPRLGADWWRFTDMRQQELIRRAEEAASR